LVSLRLPSDVKRQSDKPTEVVAFTETEAKLAETEAFRLAAATAAVAVEV
jgi:hypothetical protein